MKRVRTTPIRVITRRAKHRLEKIERRLEILDGFVKAYLNIDEVIRIIREEDEPKAELMARFGLNDRQIEILSRATPKPLRKAVAEAVRAASQRIASESIPEDLAKVLRGATNHNPARLRRLAFLVECLKDVKGH